MIAKFAELLTLQRGDEHYVILFDAERAAQVLPALERWIMDPELSFDLADGQKMARTFFATRPVQVPAYKPLPYCS